MKSRNYVYALIEVLIFFFLLLFDSDWNIVSLFLFDIDYSLNTCLIVIFWLLRHLLIWNLVFDLHLVSNIEFYLE